MNVRRELMLMLLAVSACKSPPPSFSARGVENLITSPDPSSVELFLANYGVDVDCDECVIVETLEGRKRTAYFVQPKPSCSLRREHSKGTRGELEENGEYSLFVGLNPKGAKELARCVENSTSDDGTRKFLVVVQGKAVGTTLVSDRDPEFPLLLFSGTSLLEAVGRALSIIPVRQEQL